MEKNSIKDVALSLSEQNLIFFDPEKKNWLLREEYLSGNVKQKLARAISTIGLPDWIQETMTKNIKALEEVQPLPCLPPATPEIKTACAQVMGKEPTPELLENTFLVRLGTAWISPQIIKEFIQELLEVEGKDSISVEYDRYTNTWAIEAYWSVSNCSNSVAVWGTKSINAVEIIKHCLNSKEIRIETTVDDKKILDTEATAIANQKRTELAEKFKEWIWQDKDRAIELCLEYNDRFNCYTDRSYDGSHLTFPGSNPKIKLRPHQVNAIWRILQSPTTLLPHKVGWGKTFIMVASAMELRRLQLAKKPMIVALNSTVEQIGTNFKKLYPNAKILVADKKSFEKENRRAFAAKIATQDWDCVIIAHSQFFFLKVSQMAEKEFLMDEIDELNRGCRQNDNRELIKAIERRISTLVNKVREVTASDRKDDTIDWDTLGVDALFIDEAHFFKNLGYVTRMRNVAGLSNSNAQRSMDTLMKVRQTLDKSGKVVFATGTPVANSVAELYTMQRYLDNDLLEQLGLSNFDAWAGQFGETVTAPEISPTGQYKTKTRFSKFCNLPELMRLYCRFADFPKGKIDLGEPEMVQVEVACPPTIEQQILLEQLAYRAQQVHNKKVEPEDDNMLKITNDGRKGALEIRLVNDKAENEPFTKVNRCGWNVWQIWKTTQNAKATQLIFCDLSTPNKDKHNVYEYMIDLLIALGIPHKEIAIIHDFNEKNRDKLFADVRSGKVRIVMGSTQKLGTGVDIPDRIIAEHHLDAPWRPADIEQRSGRTKRQGNQWKKVWSFRYVTEGTNKQGGFDSFLWQTLETKAKFIEQISSGQTANREAEDVDEAVLNYSIVKAIASGNPIALEKAKLDAEYANLRIKYKSWEQEKSQLSWRRTWVESDINSGIPRAVKAIEKDIQDAKRSQNKPLVCEDEIVSDIKAINKRLHNGLKKSDLTENLIGTTGLFQLLARFNWKKGVIVLKNNHQYEVEPNYKDIQDFLHQGIYEALTKKHQDLEDAKRELETIDKNIGKPFEFTDRLKEVRARINEIELELAKTTNEESTKKVYSPDTCCAHYCPPEDYVVEALINDRSCPDWLLEITNMIPAVSNIIEFPITKKHDELHLVKEEKNEFTFEEVTTKKGQKTNYIQGTLF